MTRAIVIHMTSDWVYAGFAGEPEPRVDFPAVLTSSATGGVMVQTGAQIYVGHEAVARAMAKGGVQLHYPLENGYVADWDGWSKLISHTFRQLRVNPADHPVLMLEAPMNSKRNREQVMKIMFDQFDVPKYFVGISNVIALYASGTTTGLSALMDSNGAMVVPVYEGYTLPHAVRKLEFGRGKIRERLGNLLSKAGKSFGKGESANQALRAIDAVGRIALGYESELAQPNTPTSFTLPDGGQIDLGAELFDAPEALFQPDLVGETGVGIHKMIFDSIMACDVDIRKDLFNHVLLSDGFEYEDMAERICLELTALSPESTTIKIVTPPGLEVWFGGAILSSLSTFEEMWIAKSEYDESGPSIVHKRCA